MKRTSRRLAASAFAVTAAFSLTACGGADGDTVETGETDTSITGSVSVDGSSTVYPMSAAAAELLAEAGSQVKANVASSGTGGGFEKFCAGKTDISDASRPIKDEEKAACAEGGVEFTEILVATDALTMVVNKDLAVDCLTVDQVKALWGPDSKVKNWNELDPSFPDQEIALFGPGQDSGTYDYMAADVIGAESESTRQDYEASEDDNVLVQGVSGTAGATGYFGYTYFEQNSDKLKALEIDNGEGCVAPSVETAQAGEYTPLARPLFIYVSNKAYTEEPAVKAYTDFYIENLAQIAEIGQYIPLSEELYADSKDALAGISG